MDDWRAWLWGILGFATISLVTPWLMRGATTNNQWRLAEVIRHPISIVGVVLVLMAWSFILGVIAPVAAEALHLRFRPLELALGLTFALVFWAAALRLVRFVKANRIPRP
jgi:hypothetical protein